MDKNLLDSQSMDASADLKTIECCNMISEMNDKGVITETKCGSVVFTPVMIFREVPALHPQNTTGRVGAQGENFIICARCGIEFNDMMKLRHSSDIISTTSDMGNA